VQQFRGKPALRNPGGQKILPRPGHHGAGTLQFRPVQEHQGVAFQFRSGRR
jgi:hypothetical protein